MPRKLGNVTKDVLVNAPLPVATTTYTVISHQFVIDTINQELANNGFGVKHELYKCTKDAQEAVGKFIVDYNSDPDLSMMYAFVNSYNKMIKFGATFGVYVHESESFMVGQLGDWNRKHTGTADFETQQKIEEQMADAKDYYDQLANDKAAMQKIDITRDKFGALLGTLFLRGWLTIDMVSLAAKEFDNPSYTYSTAKDNLWTCYNHILVALRQSNPRVWLANQSAIHLYMTLEFDLAQFDVDETTDGDVCQETGTTQEESNQMDNVIEQYSDILLPQDGMSECPPEEEQRNIDAPEITGIPNGDTMSDTSDLDAEEDEDWEKMGAVAIDPDGDEDHIDGVDELPNPDTTITTVEDVQSIPADNVAEVTEDYVYVSEDEYSDAKTGDIIEIDYSYYEVKHVTTIEGDNYLALSKVNMDTVEEVSEEEEKEMMAEAYQDDIDNGEYPQDEHVGPPEMYTGDTIPSTDTPFDMEVSNEVVDEVPLQRTEVSNEEVVRGIISNQIQDLYGYNPEFTFTKKDEFYDITLDSGESFVLQANYIDSMVNE